MTDLDIIADLIAREPGFVVEVKGLYVSMMKNGKFHVVYDSPPAGGEENIFLSAKDATSFFIRRRRELKLGYDLEDGDLLSEKLSEFYIG